MMKLGGIHAEKEAVNFIMDKVGESHITSYVNHISAHNSDRKAPLAIIPDLYARIFPADKQIFNDSGITSTAKAFFEIQTYASCNTCYAHNNNDTNKPQDRRAREVIPIYKSKFKKINKKFAAGILQGSSDSTMRDGLERSMKTSTRLSR